MSRKRKLSAEPIEPEADAPAEGAPAGFRTALARIHRLAAHPEARKDDMALWLLVFKSGRYMEHLAQSAELTQEFVAAVRAIRDGSGPGCRRAAREGQQVLLSVADACRHRLQGEPDESDAGPESPVELDPEAREALAALQVVCDYARECLLLKRVRDGAGGQRKDIAFETLGLAAGYLDLADVAELARERIRASRPGNLYAALEFLGEYYAATDGDVPEEVVAEFRELAARTLDRTTAVSALNVLVEAGVISEFEALDEIDDWKDRNRDNPDACW